MGFCRFNGRIPSNEGEITHMEVVPGVVEIGAFDLSVRPYLPDLSFDPLRLVHITSQSLGVLNDALFSTDGQGSRLDEPIAEHPPN